MTDRPSIVHDRKLRDQVFARDKGICIDCGRFHPKWEAEHAVPLWANGKDDLSNAVTRCPPCHKPKTSREAKQRAKTDRIRERHELMQKRRGI